MSKFPAFPHHSAQASTILVMDSDADFLSEITRLGEQLIVKVLGARNLEQAARWINHPELTGMLITVPDPPATSLPHILQTLASSRPGAEPLPPFGLIYEQSGLLVRAHDVPTPAALALQKPLDRTIFSQAVHYLGSLQSPTRLNVLLLDPQHNFARRIQTLPNAANICLHHLTHPAGLLDELEHLRPDALLLHTRTPAMSGFEICRILRTIPTWIDLPILFLTDRPDPAQRLAAFKVGGDDYLAQPIAWDEFIARLHVRVERTRLVRDRADRDILTGLLTRRAFVEQLAGRLAEVSRHARPLAFCLLDLDRFKQINDTYGHLTGDRVLATLGRLLANRFRIEDLRARWGGEEFAVVLVNEDAHTARLALQRVADEFARIPFKSEEDQTFHVTFSAGISHFPADGLEPEELLYAADQRLLDAKQTGRNRILPIFPSGHPHP